ncbi:MAG: hypothetical protein ACRD40_02130 [Candidatus Acidiferrales bacterium]
MAALKGPGLLQKVKQEFDDAGISIFNYYVNLNDTYTDEEIDATFEGAKALGAKGVIRSYGLAVAKRLAPFPAKHGMFAGLDNHDNLSEQDTFSTEESIVKGLSFSPDFKATLDVRHFTAANQDYLITANTPSENAARRSEVVFFSSIVQFKRHRRDTI